MKSVRRFFVIPFMVIGIMLLNNSCQAQKASSAVTADQILEAAKATGVEIVEINGDLIWQGKYAGRTKPKGPLAGKKVGAIVAQEFDDFQAYYLASYISEFGATLEFITVDWVVWKNSRPNNPGKGVQGLWGINVSPSIPFLGGRCTSLAMGKADAKAYDALIVVGGHSADIMVTEPAVIEFIKTAADNGAVIGAIGAGSIPIISTGFMHGKKSTGDAEVSFMLKKIGTYVDAPVVTDGKLITAKSTEFTPNFVRALNKHFDPNFVDVHKDALKGKTMLVIAGEDYEDVELAVPVMEYLYRGANVIMGTFPAPAKARPALLGLDVVQGNFGTTVPLQAIPDNLYSIKKLSELNMNEFDALQIPGAFCPWNMVMAESPIDFLKNANSAGKVLTYLCHGAIPIAAADLVEGKKVAGWLAVKDPVTIMGGDYSWDLGAVIDGNQVSARTPPELPEFIDAITIKLLR